MTPEMIELAKRAIACKGWRWMPGMMRLRVTQPQMRDYLRREGRVPDGPDEWAYDDWPVIPDLTDPATLGCVLALVREAWRDPTATTAATREADGSRGWVTDCWNPQSPLSGLGPFNVEAEALVAALEAK